MLYVPSVNSWGTKQVRWGTSGAFSYQLGNFVTPGASDAEGSWDEVLSSVTADSEVFFLAASDSNTAAALKTMVMDVGFGAAASEVEKISNLIFAQLGAGGRGYWFPLFIPASTRIAVRASTSSATAGTVANGCALFGKPSHPEMWRRGYGVETVGTFTGSAGVSVTPGNSGSFGSWTSVGTTTHACFHWNAGMQCANATQAALSYEFQWGYGDASNPTEILRLFTETNTSEAMNFIHQRLHGFCDTPFSAWKDVPAGSTIYCRAACSGTADTGWSVAAYGTY